MLSRSNRRNVVRVVMPLAVVLTACAPAQPTPPTAAPTSVAAKPTAAAAPAAPATIAPTAATAARPAASVPFDQQFIDMMVPHHEGAVEMARIARERSQRPEIQQMAADILASQAGEIEQLKAWRKAWFGSDQTPPMSRMPMLEGMPMASMAEHAMDSTGAMTMDMAAQVAKLRSAPEPFDLAFIEAMIPHHQDAVEAARLALRSAERPEVREVAIAIVDAQLREIGLLRQWRLTWFGSAAVTSAATPQPQEAQDKPATPGTTDPSDMAGMGH